jgi:multiple sugar transport system substrate-binding protein
MKLRIRLLALVGSIALLVGLLPAFAAAGEAGASRHANPVRSECGSQGATGGTHGPATVSIAYTSTQEFNTATEAKDWFAQLKAAFQKKHPGVTVKLVPIGGSATNFNEKIALMLKSGKTVPDVVHEATTNVGPQFEAHQVAPLTSYLKGWRTLSQFKRAVLLGGVPGPHIYQLVLGIVDFGLYYNANQFKQAGLPVPWQPHSWAQIIAAAKTIKAKIPGITPLFLYAGNAISTTTTRENFLPLLEGTSTPITKGLKWVVGGKGVKAVFNFYNTVFSEGLGPSLSTLASPVATGHLSGTLMPQQKVAIALVGNWVGSWWIPGGAAPFPTGASTYRVALLPTENGQAPGYATEAQGSTFVMTCASKHRRLAAQLLEMAESAHFNLLHVLWTGEVPPRSDVLRDSKYLSSVPYFNKAETVWEKYAAVTPSYNYSGYATCIGQVTALVSSSHLGATSAATQLKACASRSMGATAVTG